MKHTPSENMRTEYRRALMRCGVPAVYAHMAAKELTTHYSSTVLRSFPAFGEATADELIAGGFIWCSTKQGDEFWRAIALEAA